MPNEPRKYLEFFVIDEGYYPEINESSIKDPKNKWQYTFPHKDIIELLKKLERVLSRSDKKSLWIEGSYGTGKSRILWMIQNLLDCPEQDFDAYFNEYDNLREETDLRERLRTIRKGNVVTAFRYATGDITSTQKLIFAVFESLTASLKRGGYKFDGAKTLRGKIAAWLENDSANLELFRAKIKKPEYRMFATLTNKPAEEIVERLKNPNAAVSQLVEEILKLGEREGIRAFNIDMTDLTEWIAEVIEENNLKAVILFWDEFSKFFANNRNNLDELQRLAELSNIAPFYLVIATHQSDALTGAADQSFKTVKDRFIIKEITMPDNIAFELIGHALKIKDFAKTDWNNFSLSLIERTAEPRKVVTEFSKVRDETILTDILPIHPITAVLLKNLSAYFASNQRSIFNFIKNSDPSIKAFQDFIATKSPENGDLLTADYLWNFFYESGTDEYGGFVGRMNFRPSVRVILDSYAINEKNLSHDEKIVLKTIVLFQAIDQESHGNTELFHPTEKNLELAFNGAGEMENGRAVSIANNLVRKNILFKKPGKIETFAVMAVGGDFSEIENIKKSIKETVRTAELIESAKLLDTINLTTVQKFRYDLRPVTADNFTLIINRIANEDDRYRIKGAVCFARNEDEQNKIHNLLGDAIQNERYHKLVFIDASSNLINSEVFNRWIENAANEKFWKGKDNALADKMKDNAEGCLREWYEAFKIGSFLFYPSEKNPSAKRKKISIQNISQITEELKDNVRRLYRYSFDDADITDTLFQSSQLKKLSEAGITQEEYSMLKNRQAKIVLGDVWQMSGKYWEVYPDLNISRLKIELDELIKTAIEKNVRISFDEIFDKLVEKGFMPLNIYAFLTGFLLKEYAGDPYRFSAGVDGNFGGAMTVQKLAEYIGESIKQFQTPVKNYRPKFLEIMSRNQRRFMQFASEIFNVAEDVSVEQSAQKLRLKLINLGFPFWCYVDSANDKYKDFLSLISEISNSNQALSISALSERAGQFLSNNPSTSHDLKIFLTSQKGNELFTDFIKKFEDGKIFELAEKIGIENPVDECLLRITSGDGIWLRDKDTAVDELKKLIVDFKIVMESQKFGIYGKSFNTCVQKWREFCQFNLKVPADTISEVYPELKNFFSILKELVQRGELSQSKRENFLSQLIDNPEIIGNALSEPIKILREKYSYQVEILNDDELQNLYVSLPSSSFTDSQEQYYNNVNTSAKKIQNSQLKKELLNLWHKLAGNKSPREWSKEHRTPILAMIPKADKAAQKVIETIMTASDEKSMRSAIAYLKKNQSHFVALKNSRKIEDAFRKIIIDEKYQVILDDNNEIRDELERKFPGDPYYWYPNMRVQEIIEEFAKNKYYSGGACEQVKSRVIKMSDEEAKKLLIELLDKNFEVGLKLLMES